MPKKEGNEYRYAVFEQQPDVNISSGKSTPIPEITVTSVDNKKHSNVMFDHNNDNEVYLSLSTEKLVEMQKDDAFCKVIRNC